MTDDDDNDRNHEDDGKSRPTTTTTSSGSYQTARGSISFGKGNNRNPGAATTNNKRTRNY
jgi:hypothetical protein